MVPDCCVCESDADLATLSSRSTTQASIALGNRNASEVATRDAQRGVMRTTGADKDPAIFGVPSVQSGPSLFESYRREAVVCDRPLLAEGSAIDRPLHCRAD